MKHLKVFLLLAAVLCLMGSMYSDDNVSSTVDLNSFYDYQREYRSESVGVCSMSSVKTYMDYRAITLVASKQYQYIRNYMTVDQTGFLVDEDGFIGVALGSYYGDIGSRYYFTFSNGVTLPLVKIEAKADADTDYSGCYHPGDGSVIEFVIDTDYATSYFGRYGNGYVLQGNFANYSVFSGEIVAVEEVLDERDPDYVTYETGELESYPVDIFQYASGY